MNTKISVLATLAALIGINCNSIAAAQSLGSPAFTWTGDFNGDNVTDFASANASKVYMYLSTKSSFERQTWPIAGQWGAPEYIYVGDFNGDRKHDIVAPVNTNVFVHTQDKTQFRTKAW